MEKNKKPTKVHLSGLEAWISCENPEAPTSTAFFGIDRRDPGIRRSITKAGFFKGFIERVWKAIIRRGRI